jgi:ABC-type multidrug transport system fused ATPase/permease subunit
MGLSKFFWTLSGDDFGIIRLCRKPTKNRFTVIGALVSAIFTLCFVSCYFAFTRLFQNYIVGVPTGIFFAWMITNIYLLLLYTLSKSPFPFASNNTGRYFSITIRLLFIVFVAVIISKPIENLIFSDMVRTEIEQFKKSKLKRYSESTYDFFNHEISLVEDVIKEQKNLNQIIDSAQALEYNSLIQTKEKERDQLIKSMEQLVNRSDYYIQGIIILNTKFKLCWVITLLTVLIFLFPAYIKIFIKEDTVFYKTKHDLETKLVMDQYHLFKERYTRLLFENFNIDVQYSEPFSDAPFNTIRKREKRTIFKENDLLDSIYNA